MPSGFLRLLERHTDSMNRDESLLASGLGVRIREMRNAHDVFSIKPEAARLGHGRSGESIAAIRGALAVFAS